MVPSVVEAPNPGCAPTGYIFREIHGNLAAEAWSGPVSCYATSSQVIRDCRVNLFQRVPTLCSFSPMIASVEENRTRSVHPQTRAIRID